MKAIRPIIAAIVLTTAGAGAAQAAGCIKGAIIGGLAGHYLADRGVVGAVAGCLGGRALANRAARREVDYGARVQPRGQGYGGAQGYGRQSYGY